MENASKALLIAAAVLIVVLLIAFGMNIFNQASTSADVQGTSDALNTGITSATTELNTTIQSIINN